MRKYLILAGLVAASTFGAAAAEDKKALVAEGKGLIKQFAGTLKGELMAAMEAGGPMKAIEVCKARAPEIAAQISASSGWTVARSSHKLRNPKNAPDAYTMAAIQDFLARQAAGEKAADLAQAGIVEADGARSFRMIKAIPTGDLCLTCHGGEEVAPEVAAELARHYPDDQARGFKAGEMRGVFTLAKPLD